MKVRAESVICLQQKREFALGKELVYFIFVPRGNTETMYFESLMNTLDVKMTEP